MAVVSGGGGGLASDFVSPSGSCLTRPFHAKDVGGGSKAHATAAGPLWKECDCDKDVTRFNLGTFYTWCVLTGGVVGVVGAGVGVFFRVLGAFWGPFVGVLATWWASFWNLDGLRCLLGAQGVLESELGHVFHHFGGHIGSLF